MNKQITDYSFSRVLLRNKKELITDAQTNMGETLQHSSAKEDFDYIFQAYFILLCLLDCASQLLHFHKLEICDNPVLRMSVSSIFLAAFFSLCISVTHFGILTYFNHISQYFNHLHYSFYGDL